MTHRDLVLPDIQHPLDDVRCFAVGCVDREIRLPESLNVVEPACHHQVRYADDVIRMVMCDEKSVESRQRLAGAG